MNQEDSNEPTLKVTHYQNANVMLWRDLQVPPGRVPHPHLAELAVNLIPPPIVDKSVESGLVLRCFTNIAIKQHF